MTMLEIFEKVNLKTPVEQRVFFNYFNDSVHEIAGFYGDMPKMVFRGNITAADNFMVGSLSDDIVVLPMYHNAIVDNILFLCGQGETHKGEFVRKAREAYLHYWNIGSKHRRIKRKGW